MKVYQLIDKLKGMDSQAEVMPYFEQTKYDADVLGVREDTSTGKTVVLIGTFESFE